MSVFSERLKALRLEKNITQSQLAIKVGVRQGAINKWESGKTEPNISTIILLSKILNTSSDYLLGKTGDQRDLQSLSILLEENEKVLKNILNETNAKDFLPANLKRLRESYTISRETVEKYLNKNINYLNWELGRSEPDLDTLVKLANYFQVSVCDLYELKLYEGGYYEDKNTVSQAFRVKTKHLYSEFREKVLDVFYDFGYRYADIKVSKDKFISSFDLALLELNSMKELLDEQLSPVKENMISTREREEKSLKKDIEYLRQELKKDPYSNYIQDRLKEAEESLKYRREQEKLLDKFNEK